MVNGIKLSDLWLSHSLRTGGEKASPHGAFLLIFCAHRGAVRGGGRRIRQERLGSQEAIRKGEWIEWKIHGAKIRNMPCARREYALS